MTDVVILVVQFSLKQWERSDLRTKNFSQKSSGRGIFFQPEAQDSIAAYGKPFAQLSQ